MFAFWHWVFSSSAFAMYLAYTHTQTDVRKHTKIIIHRKHCIFVAILSATVTFIYTKASVRSQMSNKYSTRVNIKCGHFDMPMFVFIYVLFQLFFFLSLRFQAHIRHAKTYSIQCKNTARVMTIPTSTTPMVHRTTYHTALSIWDTLALRTHHFCEIENIFTCIYTCIYVKTSHIHTPCFIAAPNVCHSCKLYMSCVCVRARLFVVFHTRTFEFVQT